MSKGSDKRQAIFNKYKANLNLLIDKGFISGEKDVYLCPICLRPHKELNTSDPLTLEDAPPKSLGGKANTLTCKSCNNTAGRKIDFHLTERLREIDSARFVPGTETHVIVKVNGETLRGTLSVDADGKMAMYHSMKNNHPEKLENAMSQLKGGMVINMDFLRSRVIPENLEYALLKTGYIMAFERFGYSLILDRCFDIVRQQLLNPEQRIYPEGFWFTPPYSKSLTGVYFIDDKGLECLLAMFNLNTGKTERMFATLLPLPITNLEHVIKRINMKIENDEEIILSLFPPNYQALNLHSIEDMKSVIDWIDKRKGSC